MPGRFLLRLLAGCVALATLPLSAQRPGSFLELLEPKSQVGMAFGRDSGLLSVTLFDPEVYEVVRDSKTLDQEQLGQKYPELDAKKQASIRRYQELAAMTRDDDADSSFNVEASVGVAQSMRLCTITFVGQDYFLALDDASGRTTAYPSRRISSIQFENEVPIVVRLRRDRRE